MVRFAHYPRKGFLKWTSVPIWMLRRRGIPIVLPGIEQRYFECPVTIRIDLFRRLMIVNLLTYLLTPWYRVLLEKLTGLQLVKKFPAFHGTRRFITALTSVRHLSLSWANPIQSTYPHPTSWRSVLILSTHLRLFPSGFPTKTLYNPSPYPYAPHAQPISFF